jgi:hypothetical protein
MFERFTNQSRRAVVLAQEEARELQHNYIGTEHLLLGLLREGTGSAARALTSMGVTLDAAQREVQASVGRGEHKQPSGHIPFTPRAKKVLEQSLRECLQLGQNYIATGHLLLGLIRQDDDMAVRILGNLRADRTDLRARVTQELVDHPEQEEEAGVIRVSPARLLTTPRLPAEIRNLLETIETRLSAIEQRLGITQSVADELRSLDEGIAAVRRDKDAALDARDFGKAATLRDEEREMLAQRERVRREMKAGEGTGAEAAHPGGPGGGEQAGSAAEGGADPQAETGGSAQAGGGPDEPGDAPAATAT